MPSEVFEVEQVLDYRHRKGVLEYKIKWKNYSEEECTWEPRENLTDCSEAIKEFRSQVGLSEEGETGQEEEEEEPITLKRKRNR
jgi:hypothetical protein